GGRPEARALQGIDGEALHQRGRLALRRPLRASLRRARVSARQRRRAAASRASGRPDLGGHQRDPAADRRPRAGAARGREHPALSDSSVSAPPPLADPTPLLEPRSVAVVGANDRPGSYADIVLRNLARAGFEGEVWGVNPRRNEVHGRPCVPSVVDLPRPVDAVVVAIPAPGVPDVIADAVARGCGGAVVLSAGFGEVEAGRELERRLGEIATGGGLPLCGPNGNGIVAVRSR